MSLTKVQNKLLDEISDLANPSGVAVHGTDTNNDAPAGYIGEHIESTVGSFTTGAASATWADATSITLTPGDWDVSEMLVVQSQAATSVTTINSGISDTPGNSASGLTLGTNQTSDDFSPALGNTFIKSTSVPSYRIKLTATTTIYLKYFIVWSTTAAKYTCRLSARRAR